MKRVYEKMDGMENIPMKVSVTEKTNSVDLPLVDHSRISKNSALDLVQLAMEIEESFKYVKSNACNKLKMIADQVKFLHKQAENVLLEARQNASLHKIPCNFVKHPGHIYHLYERSSGEQYFSMLSPEEWGNSGPLQQYKGSFRLEEDHSWTPLCKIQEKDEEMKILEHCLNNDGAPKLPQLTQQYYN